MGFSRRGFFAPVLLAMAGTAGCTSARGPESSVVLAPGAGVVGSGSAGAIAAAEKTALAFTAADVEFMAGMIPHHAQAITIARWAASHGARSDVQKLAERIIVSQRDEIGLMQAWLRERSQPVPDSMATRHVMKMGDVVHEMLMPGMLTDEQLAELDRARGSAFDRLFLTAMIAHHQGAIDMVRELFRHPNAGEDMTVFRFASDVEADQSAEIQRMQHMLESIPR